MELPSDKQHAENTSSQKNTKRKANMSAEYYRKKLIDLRASLAQEREKKKADNAHLCRLGEASFVSFIKGYVSQK